MRPNRLGLRGNVVFDARLLASPQLLFKPDTLGINLQLMVYPALGSLRRLSVHCQTILVNPR